MCVSFWHLGSGRTQRAYVCSLATSRLNMLSASSETSILRAALTGAAPQPAIPPIDQNPGEAR